MNSPCILVCGSRHWTDTEQVRVGLLHASALARFNEMRRSGRVTELLEIQVVHGGAAGADAIAAEVARLAGIPARAFPANWDRDVRAAGPLRNQRMLDETRPVVALAFLDPERECRGTRDMMERCFKAGVPVLVFTPADIYR